MPSVSLNGLTQCHILSIKRPILLRISIIWQHPSKLLHSYVLICLHDCPIYPCRHRCKNTCSQGRNLLSLSNEYWHTQQIGVLIHQQRIFLCNSTTDNKSLHHDTIIRTLVNDCSSPAYNCLYERQIDILGLCVQR